MGNREQPMSLPKVSSRKRLPNLKVGETPADSSKTWASWKTDVNFKLAQDEVNDTESTVKLRISLKVDLQFKTWLISVFDHSSESWAVASAPTSVSEIMSRHANLSDFTSFENSSKLIEPSPVESSPWNNVFTCREHRIWVARLREASPPEMRKMVCVTNTLMLAHTFLLKSPQPRNLKFTFATSSLTSDITLQANDHNLSWSTLWVESSSVSPTPAIFVSGFGTFQGP